MDKQDGSAQLQQSIELQATTMHVRTTTITLLLRSVSVDNELVLNGFWHRNCKFCFWSVQHFNDHAKVCNGLSFSYFCLGIYEKDNFGLFLIYVTYSENCVNNFAEALRVHKMHF